MAKLTTLCINYSLIYPINVVPSVYSVIQIQDLNEGINGLFNKVYLPPQHHLLRLREYGDGECASVRP